MHMTHILDTLLTLGDAQFEIRFVTGEQAFARQAFDALSKALPSIIDYFQVSKPFPKIRVVFANSRSEFDSLVRDLLHVNIEVPSNPARVAQPQRTDLGVLSPSAYKTHSIYKYDPDEFRRLLLHELVHMMEEFITPDMETSPRWWSEGLAVYLSGQWLHEDDFRKPVLEGIAGRNVPGFSSIEAERKLAYAWGWTIVRFIETTYGRDMIRRMVEECADGQVLAVIGEGAAGLEECWRDWLLAEGSLVPASSSTAGTVHIF